MIDAYLHLITPTEQLNLRGYYANLQQLIEEMYEQNSNTKLTLVLSAWEVQFPTTS